jgi:hypothetical protein
MAWIDPKKLAKHEKERRRAERRALKEAKRALRRQSTVQPAFEMVENGRNAPQSA